MRFLLDENETPAILPLLKIIHPRHVFDYAVDVGLGGLKDVVLIPRMRDRGYEALITRDANQLNNADERHALLYHGVHWIGHKPPPGTGAAAITALTAAYVAAFPHVLAKLNNRIDAHAFFIQHIPHGAQQRLKVRQIRV